MRHTAVIILVFSIAGLLGCENETQRRAEHARKHHKKIQDQLLQEVEDLQDAELPAGLETVDGLQAELTLGKHQFLHGELIQISLAIRNAQTAKKKVWEHASTNYGYHAATHFVVESSDGRRLLLGNPPGDPSTFHTREIPFYGTRELKSGDTYDWTTTLNDWWPQHAPFVFLPGHYTVWARHKIHPNDRVLPDNISFVWSNPVRFEVTDEVQKTALDDTSWHKIGEGLQVRLRTEKNVYVRGENVSIHVDVVYDGPLDELRVPAGATVGVRLHGGYRYFNLDLSSQDLSTSHTRSLLLQKGKPVTQELAVGPELWGWNDALPMTYRLELPLEYQVEDRPNVGRSVRVRSNSIYLQALPTDY